MWLERLKREHGTPQAESIRRAVAAYLTDKRVSPKLSQREVWIWGGPGLSTDGPPDAKIELVQRMRSTMWEREHAAVYDF
jgi:hypothetical protein